MRNSRRRYIALCQRLLALGVVVVALVPAAGVVSLDVVRVEPTRPDVPRQPLEVSVDIPAQGRPTDETTRRSCASTQWRPPTSPRCRSRRSTRSSVRWR